MDILVGMREFFNKRKSTYTGAKLSLVLIKQNDTIALNSGSVCFTSIYEDDDISTDYKRNYGDLIFIKQKLSIEDAWDFIEKLSSCAKPNGFDFSFSKPDFKRPDWERVQDDLPCPLGQERFSLWPTKSFLIINKDNNNCVPYGPRVKQKLPLIVNTAKAVNDWIGFDYGRAGGQNCLLVSLPDFRAKIKQIAFDDSEVKVIAEPGFLSTFKLTSKVSLDTHEEEALAQGSTFLIRYSELPSSLTFFLIDAEKDEVIDWAEVYLSWTNLASQIQFLSSRKRIEQMIDSGESNQLEFKKSRGDGFTLIQSVVAFANTTGGVILIGVEDDCSICGTDPKVDKAKIVEWIENRCDPPISVDFETIQINEKEILVIRVPEGATLHQHRDNGIFYVRRGDNDRPIRRAELQMGKVNKFGGSDLQ